MMLKRIFLFVLCACLLVGLSACGSSAEKVEDGKANEPFTLRNGYTFGMSMEEVAALAEEEGLTKDEEFSELDSRGQYNITFSNVPVSLFVAEKMMLIFDENMFLSALVYNFGFRPSSEAEGIIETLMQLLEDLYGEKTKRNVPVDNMVEDVWLLSDDVDISLTSFQVASDEETSVFLGYRYLPAFPEDQPAEESEEETGEENASPSFGL